MENEIIDANGFVWKWDGERVYMVLAEEEMIANGEDPEENGYPAYSFARALEILTEFGYMHKEK